MGILRFYVLTGTLVNNQTVRVCSTERIDSEFVRAYWSSSSLGRTFGRFTMQRDKRREVTRMAKVRPKKRARVVRPKRSNRAAAAPPREPERILYTFKENSAWVAGFVPFDLVAQGSTEAEARQRLDSAIAATILWDIEDGVEPLSRVKQTPKDVVATWARKHRETRTARAPEWTPDAFKGLDARPGENVADAVTRVIGERDGLLAERDRLVADRDRLHTKCSDLVKQQDDWDNKLRGIMDASQFEQVDAVATRLVEEVQAWRSGCEAAFGGHTANPHKTLVEIAKAQRDYREKHHDLERLLIEASNKALLRLPAERHDDMCASREENGTCDCGFVEAEALRKQVAAMLAQHLSEVP